MKLRSAALILLFFFIYEPVLGQGFSFTEYYSPADYGISGERGHPQNWSFHLDSDHFLFVGNGHGLLTFDGNRWNTMHIGESGRGISLFMSNEGHLYANGSRNFGKIVHDSLNSIAYKSISDNYFSPDKQQFIIWETYQNEGVIYYRHNEGIATYNPVTESFKNYAASARLHASFLVNDQLFVDSQSGLLNFRNGEYEKVEGSEMYSRERLFFAFSLPNGDFLLGSTDDNDIRKGHLRIFDGEEFIPFRTEVSDYLQNNFIYDGLMIGEDRMAIATIYGGVVFLNRKGELINILNERSGLQTNTVYDLYLDHENTLWLGLSNGIQKISMNDQIIHFSEKAGFEDTINKILITDDEVYLYNYQNLYKKSQLEPENVSVFEKMNDPQELQNLIMSLPDFMTWQNNIYAYGTEGFLRIESSGDIVKLISEPVKKYVQPAESNTHIYLITDNDLITFDGNEIVDRNRINDLGEIGFVTSFNDQIFATIGQQTGSHGIAMLENGAWTNIPVQYDSSHTFGIIQFGIINGNLFAGTEGGGSNSGLYEYFPEEGVFRKSDFLSDYPDFQNKQIFRFQQCENGNIWFSANKKLIKVSRKDGDWDVNSSKYRQISKNPIYSIACADNGVWIGGTSNLYFVKNDYQEVKNQHQVNITGIYLRGDSLIYGGYGDPVKAIVLPYSDNELRFNFSAASYIDPSLNTYQVKLEGFDNNWSSWSKESQKDYTNIPEGSYTFHVRSKNAFNDAGIADSIMIQILPPWYRTWWAYLLYTITIAGILYTVYKIRVNQLLRVERIRNNIASDLHDEVSATLSSISYFAKAIESDKVAGDKHRFVQLIAKSAGDAKEKITDIVWAINPEHDDWTGFLSKCRRYASDLLESKHIDYSLKIQEHIPGKLDMQLRQHLWLIFKEMVTNAARHSEAENIDIIISYQAGFLNLVLQDDGKGMDVDQVKKGNGLVNINKRADQIGADINLKTSEGFGTRWKLKVQI